MNFIAYFSKAAYKGNGATTNYSAPFPYIVPSHVAVTVDAIPKPFTWLNTGTVCVTPAPANGSSVVVKRLTPRDVRLVDFKDGSFLTERELDLSALQLLYILQELADETSDLLGYDFSSNKYDAHGKPITNVGDPISDADVVTLHYFKTVVLPMLTDTVDQALKSFTDPLKDELERYRQLLEDYRARLDAATANMENTTNAAVIKIEELSNAAQTQFDSFMADLQALSILLTQQAEAVRLATLAATNARDEVRAMTADVKDFRYKGDWRNGTVYRPQNVVTYGGSSFVLVSGDGTNEPPADISDEEEKGWKLLAKRGENYYARILDGGSPDTEFTVFIDGGTPDTF